MSYRWLVLGTLVAALVVTSYGMFTPWIDVPDFATIKIDRGVVEQVPQVMWILAGLGTVFIAYGMYRGRVPGISALLTALVALAGGAAMLWIMRSIGAGMAVDRFTVRTDIVVAPGAWLVVVGFGVAALAALSLWRLSSSQVRDSKPAS